MLSTLFAAALGAGINVGGGLLTSKLSGQGSIKGKSATDRRIREQYQTLVKDLRLAGLNPALAYGSARPTASATGTALASGVPFDPARGVTSGIDAYRGSTKLDPETQLINQNITSAKAQARKTNAEAKVIEEHIPEAEFKGRLWDKANKGGAAVEDLSIWGQLKQIFTGEQPRTSANPNGPTVTKRTNKHQRSNPRKRRPTKP